MDDMTGRSLGDLRADIRGTRRRWTRPVLLLLASVGLAMLGWFGWRSWTGSQAQTRPNAQPAQPVGAIGAADQDIRVIDNALGTVTSLNTVTIKTQIAGKIVTIGFGEGQMVNAGQFLAQIDPRPYQVALDQAQGALARDQAQLKNAQVDLQRYQTLLRQDSVARQQVDTQAALVRQYQGTLKTDQAAIDQAQLNLTYCRIVSPITGRVGLRQVDVGNYVQPSDATGLVVIAQIAPISVLFSLPEDQVPPIVKAMRTGRVLPVEVWDRADENKLETGELSSIDNQVDVTTGTVKMRATFANPDELLFPNQFVNAHVLVDTLHDALAIPNAAVQRGEPGTFVYLIGDGGTVHVQKVKLGPIDGANVAVLDGLKAGDQVVTDGADRLREGAKVTVPGSTAGGTAAVPGSSEGRTAAPDGQPRAQRRRPKQ